MPPRDFIFLQRPPWRLDKYLRGNTLLISKEIILHTSQQYPFLIKSDTSYLNLIGEATIQGCVPFQKKNGEGTTVMISEVTQMAFSNYSGGVISQPSYCLRFDLGKCVCFWACFPCKMSVKSLRFHLLPTMEVNCSSVCCSLQVGSPSRNIWLFLSGTLVKTRIKTSILLVFMKMPQWRVSP